MNDHLNSIHNPDGSPACDEQQTVLLVDNDHVRLKYMSEVLRRKGYGIAVFYDAASAHHFSILGVRRFDLVITDYRLPGINGLELVEALKRQHPDVPMVLLIEHGDIESYSKAVDPGIFEYIIKPMNTFELLRIVQEALGEGMPEQVPVVRKSVMANAE